MGPENPQARNAAMREFYAEARDAMRHSRPLLPR